MFCTSSVDVGFFLFCFRSGLVGLCHGNFERPDPLNDGAPTLKIVINFLSGVGENMFFSNSSEFGSFDYLKGLAFKLSLSTVTAGAKAPAEHQQIILVLRFSLTF